MSTAPVQMLFPEAKTEFGTVLSRAGHKLRIDLPSGERSAEVASSCLLAPSPGDRVLLAYAGQEAYVLAVLRQRADSEAHLTFDRDVSLNVVKGRLRVLAQEGVCLVSPREVKVHSGSLSAHAEQMHATFSLLDVVGQSIVSKTRKVRVVSEAVDTVAGRIYQRAVNFLRRTDELDRVEAKNIDRRAEQLVHTHGQNAVTTAEELVKIDAGQVHVG